MGIPESLFEIRGSVLSQESEKSGNWLDSVSKYASIVEAAGLLIAIGSISVQWTQENRLARAEHAQAMTDQSAEFHFKIIESDTLTELWFGYGRKPNMTPVERMQYKALLQQYFVFQENAYFQYQSGLLDERIYRSLDKDLKTAMKKHDLTVLDGPLESLYAPEFADHSKALVNEP